MEYILFSRLQRNPCFLLVIPTIFLLCEGCQHLTQDFLKTKANRDVFLCFVPERKRLGFFKPVSFPCGAFNQTVCVCVSLKEKKTNSELKNQIPICNKEKQKSAYQVGSTDWLCPNCKKPKKVKAFYPKCIYSDFVFLNCISRSVD